MKRIAVLTGGGHISSFHSGIAGIMRSAGHNNVEVIGFRDGYKGAKEKDYCIMNKFYVKPGVAGSYLGSTRDKADERVKKTIEQLGIDALIVMGGDDHLAEAAKLHEIGVPVVGWPKTMDNDLSGTYFCLGYPTAVEVAYNVMRCAHVNAQTNSRIHIVTMFGRNTDWIVAGAGSWGHADVVVPCEQEYKFEDVFNRVQSAADENLSKYGRRFALVAVAEGAKIRGLENHLREDEIDAHGNPKLEPMKLALVLKDAFKKMNDKCVSIDSVSYMMRDSPPNSMDQHYADLAGCKCVELALAGEFGQAAIIEDVDESGRILVKSRPLTDVAKKRYLKPEGFIDYENLRVNKSFSDYYLPFVYYKELPGREALIYPRIDSKVL